MVGPSLPYVAYVWASPSDTCAADVADKWAPSLVDQAYTNWDATTQTCLAAGYIPASAQSGVGALIEAAFQMPSPEVLATVSSAAFFAPLFFYLVGLMVGKVAGVNK